MSSTRRAEGQFPEAADPPARRPGVVFRQGRLLRLAISCPGCGTRPALRVTEENVRDIAHHPPDARLGTYQCHRRHCGTIYDLTARAYQNAS